MTASPWDIFETLREPASPPPERPPVVFSAVGTDSAYATAALERESGEVASTSKGRRQEVLNNAAFSLGQLVAGGVLDEADVVNALRAASQANGHIAEDGIKVVDDTIRHGLKDGAQQPRGVPERPDVDDWVKTLPTALTAPKSVPEGEEPPPADDAAEVSRIIREKLPTLDWHALWNDTSEEEWIVEPLLPARRLVALYSAPKVGKSLLLLELCVAMATGRDVLGVSLDRPRRVLYVDFENDPKADIRERLQALGVGPDDLGRLHYLSFPTLAALDSDRGGQELMLAVAEYECEVVVVDTVSRAIAGEENENDTWLNFYRHTGLRMKQQGVAMIRLDHSGKDETKGQRGGSAKSGDVDAVWRMSRLTDDSYRLDCEAARMPIHEKTLVLHRERTPLRHRVDALGRNAAKEIQIEDAVRALDAADVPKDWGRDKAAAVLRGRGFKVRNGPLSDAIKRRRPPETKIE